MKRIERRPMLCDPAVLPAELPAVLRRVYAARGVRDPRELALGAEHLHPPLSLGGLPRAVDLLVQALKEGQRVMVVGDFDADGATSSALMVRGLRALGAARIDYLVPNRFDFGYGLTPEIVAVAAQQSPELLITVDNGVSSIAGVSKARELGMRVLVTDHHLPGATLPAADAMVNPNLPDDGFPSKHLAGVGVAFYVLMALRARLRELDWFADRGVTEPNLAQWLDLVALGTVADVVPLDHNNRVLVEQGLRRIRAGQCVPGITALLQIANRDPARIVASDLGFAVGPRLNAAGRLEDMSLGIECLLCDDPKRARQLAQQLDALNRERREIEADMQQQAVALLDRLELQEGALPPGICVFEPDWHQGVIGILAARIRERYHRPVIAFAGDGDAMLKGSARSIPGLHIRDCLEQVASRHPGLIRKFGGHAMAAGLSIAGEDFAAFNRAFADTAARMLNAEDLEEVLHTDGELALADINLDLAEQLRAAGPWGQHFPEPRFEGVFEVAQQRLVGERHFKLGLRHPQQGTADPCFDAIAFNQDPASDLNGQRLKLVYRLDANHFRGSAQLQLVVDHWENT